MSYTQRERVRYVETMWAEGLTPRAAERKWGGHPGRSSLRKWELAALAGGLPAERPRVRGACEHAKHAAWPPETKAEAVRRVRAGEKPAHVARSMGIAGGGATVSGWARAEGAKMSPPGAKGAPREGRRPPVDEAARRRIAELEARVAELEEQAAVLRELMRDPKAGDPASLSPRRKAELGERLRRERGWRLARVLTFFCISKSTYLYHRARILAGRAEGASRGASDDAAVLAAFRESGGRYGYRRLAAETGLPQRRVRASVRRQGLLARDSRKARRWSSYAGEVSEAPPNLLLGDRGHDFSAPAPNVRWATDITEMRAGPRKLYLSVIVDLFDGGVVAWRCSARPDAELANSTLRDALAALAPGEAPLVHSDRGAHYRWPGWVAICERAGLTRSMSRKGHSPDNAACEALFGRVKVEVYHGVDWSQAGPEGLAEALGLYLSWYNSGRLKSFREPGRRTRTRYETIDGRRRRLGLPA